MLDIEESVGEQRVMNSEEFSITFEDMGDYLYAFVQGPKDSLETTKKYVSQIHSKANQSGYSAILVEEDFPNQLSTLEMYACAESIANLFRGKFKIAHVDKVFSDFELNCFGETVGHNRGLRAKTFNNR